MSRTIRLLITVIVSMSTVFPVQFGQRASGASFSNLSHGTSTGATSAYQSERSSSSMPENPDEKLPSSLASSIPNSATAISGNLAVTKSGIVKNMMTGETISDPKIVGTLSTPPNPLAKTNGASFIPVDVGSIREAMSHYQQHQQNTASITNLMGTVSRYSETQPVSLSNSGFGAHWGSYNATQAFFNANNSLFAQQAKGVIDVSSYQGNIDWSAAKADGVEGAIIQIGYGWGNGFDSQALRNISECKRLGIPFGVYLYSYAYDNATAADEGNSLVSLLEKAKISPEDMAYPVFYDLEKWVWTGHQPPTLPSAYDGIANAWYAKMISAGYTNLGVYSYTNYLQTALNSDNIHSKTRWVAQYGANMDYSFSTNDRGWQYSSTGTVKGIDTSVDLNAFGVLSPPASSTPTPVFRLYNPNSGLHHYTTSNKEKDYLVTAGWRFEGASFNSVPQNSTNASPVYREYNPNNGCHNWTMNKGEHDALVSLGWKNEGIAWYVKADGPIYVYRLYNPNSGEHVFTTNPSEYQTVVNAGWNGEGVAWKGVNS